MGHLTIWTSNNYFADNSKLIETNQYIYIYLLFKATKKSKRCLHYWKSQKSKPKKLHTSQVCATRSWWQMNAKLKVPAVTWPLCTKCLFWKYLSIIGTLLWYIWLMPGARVRPNTNHGVSYHQLLGFLPSTINVWCFLLTSTSRFRSVWCLVKSKLNSKSVTLKKSKQQNKGTTYILYIIYIMFT